MQHEAERFRTRGQNVADNCTARWHPPCRARCALLALGLGAAIGVPLRLKLTRYQPNAPASIAPLSVANARDVEEEPLPSDGTGCPPACSSTPGRGFEFAISGAFFSQMQRPYRRYLLIFIVLQI